MENLNKIILIFKASAYMHSSKGSWSFAAKWEIRFSFKTYLVLRLDVFSLCCPKKQVPFCLLLIVLGMVVVTA